MSTSQMPAHHYIPLPPPNRSQGLAPTRVPFSTRSVSSMRLFKRSSSLPTPATLKKSPSIGKAYSSSHLQIPPKLDSKPPSPSSISSKDRKTSDSFKYPDFSIRTRCQQCNKCVKTVVEHENGACVYVLASGLFLTTLVLFWIPFFVDAVKDVKHFCPNCHTNLGTKHRL